LLNESTIFQNYSPLRNAILDFGALTTALGAALFATETLGAEAGSEGRGMLMPESKRPDPAID
jgi:hypothetical protein